MITTLFLGIAIVVLGVAAILINVRINKLNEEIEDLQMIVEANAHATSVGMSQMREDIEVGLKKLEKITHRVIMLEAEKSTEKHESKGEKIELSPEPEDHLDQDYVYIKGDKYVMPYGCKSIGRHIDDDGEMVVTVTFTKKKASEVAMMHVGSTI